MDWDRLEGNWKQLTGKVKEQWASSLTTTSRRSTAIASNSKEKSRPGYGYAKEQVRKDIDDWLRRQ
jgi:uncharacterized protein YjbJ (UPF0337 family)